MENGERAAKTLWREVGVRTLPGGYIAKSNSRGNPGERYIRVALVQDETTTAAGLERLRRVL